MKLADFYRHFIDGLTPPWLEGENAGNTCDRIILGDPEKEVRNVLVTWMPSFIAVREAAKRKADLLLVHEPFLYAHGADHEMMADPAVWKNYPKAVFAHENGVALMRLHDRWDIWPRWGIPYAWSRFLGFTGEPVAIHPTIWPGTLHRYDMTPMTLGDFARRVAARTAAVGEPHPIVVGDLEQVISKVGVGTGCGCQVEGFREIGCDASMICDDGSCYWGGIQRWEDEAHPVIRVNHGTSEEPGMASLTEYVNATFPGVKAEYLPLGRAFHQI